MVNLKVEMKDNSMAEKLGGPLVGEMAGYLDKMMDRS